MENLRGNELRRAVGSLALLLALLLVAVLRNQPPSPKPEDAPAGEFSAGRARQVLRNLVGDGVPHPVGSEANARVRERIVAELTRLDYEPAIQQTLSCRWNRCATVHNVLARLAGREPGPAVVLVTHYDSVPAGPGASDDGAAVAAALEIARALKSGPELRRPIIFLITDGEEAGLLGAKAFVDEHPWAVEVGAVVDLEARGSSGPSVMFETGNHNLGLIRLLAGTVKRPVTNSIFNTIYQRLPNDTDFTEFRRKGIQGFNFGYVRNVVHYHTPLDNWENAHPGSLQHHGDNALASLRALGDTDWDESAEQDAVFFDVFSLWTVWWPESWTLTLAGIALFLLAATIIQWIRRGQLKPAALGWGLLASLGGVVLTLLLALGLNWVLKTLGAFPSSWTAHPLPVIAAFWLLAFAATNLIATLLRRRAGAAGLWSATWSWWALSALTLAWYAPGMSYLFLVPALAAGLAGVLAAYASDNSPWTKNVVILLPMAAAAVLWFPLLLFLYDAMGSPVLFGVAAMLAIVLTTAAPMTAIAEAGKRWYLPASAGLLTVVAAGAALMLPPYSEQAPERMNIAYHLDGATGQAGWLVTLRSRNLPEGFRQAASFGDEPSQPAGLPTIRRAFEAEAPLQDWPLPEFTVLEDSSADGHRTLRGRLRSPRGARDGAIFLPGDAPVESTRAAGRLLPEPSARVRSNPRFRPYFWSLSLPPEGIEVEFVFSGAGPSELIILDRSAGLPPEGEALLAARPATAVRSGQGDVSFVTRRIALAATDE